MTNPDHHTVQRYLPKYAEWLDIYYAPTLKEALDYCFKYNLLAGNFRVVQGWSNSHHTLNQQKENSNV